MGKNRYYSNTLGLNAEVLIAGDQAYTADATYKDFVASDAPEGQIGVFNATTGALITAAIAAGTKYFIAQKRDSGTFRTSTIDYSRNELKKIAYTAPVKQVSTVNVIAGYVPAVTDEEFAISIIETTPGNQPFPRWSYQVTAVAGETQAQLLDRLIAQANDVNNIRNADNGSVVTMSRSGNVITITAKHFGSNYRIALQGKAFDVATSVYTTPFKLGSGFYDHVASLELAGNIFDGVTTQYPTQNATNEEFGTPTKFALVTRTYDIYQIADRRTESSPTPTNETVHFHNVIIAVPVVSGILATPSVAINTVLGF